MSRLWEKGEKLNPIIFMESIQRTIADLSSPAGEPLGAIAIPPQGRKAATCPSMIHEPPRRPQKSPPLVRIVLTQAAKYRRNGSISAKTFEAQVRRLVREELEPRGLQLLVRDLAGGRTRFLIKEGKTGTVCDLFEYVPDGGCGNGEVSSAESSAPG